MYQSEGAEISQEQIEQVLSTRRQQLGARACYPCRQRKVRCDHGSPCRTCRRRGHPEICAYDVKKNQPMSEAGTRHHRNTAHRRSPPASRDGTAEASPPHLLHTPVSTLQSTSPTDVQTSGYIFSGERSVASIIYERATDGDSAPRNIPALLGLDNILNNYPFMEQSSVDSRLQELEKLSPKRVEILSFYHFYRSRSYPFTPIIVDIDEFESSMCRYLQDGQEKDSHSPSPTSDSSSWSQSSIEETGLLLAALASGAHFSDLGWKERSGISSDLVRRSFQTLRIANFLIRPSLTSIQTLLLIGCVLQNSGQSDASWSLLGLTIRLGQKLGLHRERTMSRYAENVRSKAKAVWNMITWQDGLLSLCHDRPTSASIGDWVKQDPSTNLDFTKLMHQVCILGLENLKREVNPRNEVEHSVSVLGAFDATLNRAVPHLRSLQSCKTLQDHLEHSTLKIRTNLFILVQCRPVFHGSFINSTKDHDTLRQRAKKSLIEISKAFLHFQALSHIPLRTWSTIHGVLIAALLMSFWEESRLDTECRNLQQQIIKVFSNAGANEEENDFQWLPRDHLRAFIALLNVVRSGDNTDRTDSDKDVEHLETSRNSDVDISILQANLDPLQPLSPGIFDVFSKFPPTWSTEMSPIDCLDLIMNSNQF